MATSTSPQEVLREKAASVCETLDAAYGELIWRSHGEPMGALVMTILSQHTSDKNSERAYDNLRRTFPDWDAVRNAEVTAIADAIRSGGLADAKAPRIKSVLQAIYEDRGTTGLDFLEDLSTEAARAYLLQFHGVGPKTMACVLMFSLGRPVLPVDTHVFRVSHRLGLIPQKIGEAKAHNALESILVPERVYAFHVHMIRHGRRVCVAQRPRCASCVLQDQCDYFRSNTEAAGSNVFEPQNRSVRTIHGNADAGYCFEQGRYGSFFRISKQKEPRMSLIGNNGEDSMGAAEETVAVYSAPDMIAAELLRGTLEVEGIDAVIGEQVTGVYAGALAVGEGYAAEVRVPVESVEAAQEIVLGFIRDTESGASQPVSDEDLTAQAEAAYDPQV